MTTGNSWKIVILAECAKRTEYLWHRHHKHYNVIEIHHHCNVMIIDSKNKKLGFAKVINLTTFSITKKILQCFVGFASVNNGFSWGGNFTCYRPWNVLLHLKNEPNRARNKPYRARSVPYRARNEQCKKRTVRWWDSA
jgi:hypothetical protein